MRKLHGSLFPNLMKNTQKSQENIPSLHEMQRHIHISSSGLASNAAELTKKCPAVQGNRTHNSRLQQASEYLPSQAVPHPIQLEIQAPFMDLRSLSTKGSYPWFSSVKNLSIGAKSLNFVSDDILATRSRVGLLP